MMKAKKATTIMPRIMYTASFPVNVSQRLYLTLIGLGVDYVVQVELIGFVLIDWIVKIIVVFIGVG